MEYQHDNQPDCLDAFHNQINKVVITMERSMFNGMVIYLEMGQKELKFKIHNENNNQVLVPNHFEQAQLWQSLFGEKELETFMAKVEIIIFNRCLEDLF